jgi:Fic family protein
MAWASRSSPDYGPITVEYLLEAHRRLTAGTRLEQYGGHIRTEQNWIGGSDYNPCSASFVPPPPEEVEELLADLAAFCNTDSLPAVAQAALAHAQFETIHPFVDGNGRIGRVLIHLILKKRGLAERILPPVSLILATWSRDYVEGLTATRYVGEADSDPAHEGTNKWIAMFASACNRAVADASDFEHRIRALQQEWRGRASPVRKDSAAARLIQALPGTPVLTVRSAAAVIERSFVQTNQAISRLIEAGILSPLTLARRNRAFEARDVVDAFADLERQLASPEGNTLASPPSRRVPPRRPARIPSPRRARQ